MNGYIIAFDYDRKNYRPTYFNYFTGQSYNKEDAFLYTDVYTATSVYDKIQIVQHSPYLREKDRTLGSRLLGNMEGRKISIVSTENNTEITNNYI